MDDSSLLAPGTLLADKFRIVRPLGAGAMGAVYLIRHEITHHQRALKLLHASLRSVPEVVRRFLNEASAAGRAGNPHLVETFDGGTLPGGEPYLVMELLDGETLSALVRREGALSVGVACELVAQAADGIEAAHRAGIIHRDIKSDNLFVVQREGAPFVKILDFGVSKFRSGATLLAETAVGQVYGTPAYMAPEQLEGSDAVAEPADVFSLGVVLFECLAGQRPFDERSFESLIASIIQGKARSLASLRADLPPALLEVVARALAPAQAERFATARALSQALAPFRGLQAPSVDRATTEGLLRTQTEFAQDARRMATPPSSQLPRAPKRVPLSVMLIAVGLVGVLIAGGVLFRARSRDASRSSVEARLPAATVLAAKPSPSDSALAEPSKAISPAPVVTHEPPPEPPPEPQRAEAAQRAPAAIREHGRKASPQASSPSPTESASSAAKAAQPTAAQRLGIRESNPFQ